LHYLGIVDVDGDKTQYGGYAGGMDAHLAFVSAGNIAGLHSHQVARRLPGKEDAKRFDAKLHGDNVLRLYFAVDALGLDEGAFVVLHCEVGLTCFGDQTKGFIEWGLDGRRRGAGGRCGWGWRRWRRRSSGRWIGAAHDGQRGQRSRGSPPQATRPLATN